MRICQLGGRLCYTVQVSLSPGGTEMPEWGHGLRQSNDASRLQREVLDLEHGGRGTERKVGGSL